jgi:tRNA threonylcarbamoyladenosine biosynthesis protein TsaB
MNLLALSTSGPVPSAALLRDGNLIGIKRDDGGLTHSETIMPLADALLAEHGLSVRDVDVFAADVGPGSFTGVRIGVCAVNAMAAAFAKPVVAVSALEALAFSVRERSDETVCALLDARGGRGYAAVYGEMQTPPSAVDIAPFLQTLPPNMRFVGDWKLHEDTICAAVQNPRFSQDNTLLADSIASLAWEYYQRGAFGPEIMPLYLRPTQAERLGHA